MYCKGILENGELARGMYTRGPACLSPELAQQTTLLIERPGSLEKLSNEKRVVILRVDRKRSESTGEWVLVAETIIEILPTDAEKREAAEREGANAVANRPLEARFLPAQ